MCADDEFRAAGNEGVDGRVGDKDGRDRSGREGGSERVAQESRMRWCSGLTSVAATLKRSTFWDEMDKQTQSVLTRVQTLPR